MLGLRIHSLRILAVLLTRHRRVTVCQAVLDPKRLELSTVILRNEKMTITTNLEMIPGAPFHLSQNLVHTTSGHHQLRDLARENLDGLLHLVAHHTQI